MNSPYLQSTQPQGLQRSRTNSNLSVQSAEHRSGVRKRSTSRSPSISASHLDRLHQLALNESTQADLASATSSTTGAQWTTSYQSPQPSVYSSSSLEPFPDWTQTTPPHSDSDVPSFSVDPTSPATHLSAQNFANFSFDPPETSTDMSSLGFLLPSQYGNPSLYAAEPSTYNMDQNYIPPMRMSHPVTNAPSGYGQTAFSSSPALYQSRSVPEASSRRHSAVPSSTYQDQHHQSYRRVSSPYGGSMPTPAFGATSGQTIPPIGGLTQSPMPSPHLGASSGGSMMSGYQSDLSRSPSMYDQAMYGTSAPSQTSLYASSQSISYPPAYISSNACETTIKPTGIDASMRALNQRPKPQCWEHGCNGRQFSTFSNLLRHQREKSGTAQKSYCPKCGAEFTRTTARNGHLAHDKCTKRGSDSGSEER